MLCLININLKKSPECWLTRNIIKLLIVINIEKVLKLTMETKSQIMKLDDKRKN